MSLQLLPKKLAFEGAHNFRDMGGYPVADGEQLQYGRLFRSDRLSGLTDADVDQFEALGIRTVVDFRRRSEKEEAPDRVEDTVASYQWLPVEAEGSDVMSLRQSMEQGELSAEQAFEYLKIANQQFILDYSAVYSKFMSILLDPASYPLVFHCTAGKDRAGFAAASVLMSLGASRDVVMHDYLATNLCTADFLDTLMASLESHPKFSASMDSIKTLMQVDPAFLGEAFATIDREYDSTCHYLEAALGMGTAERGELARLLCR